MSNPGEYKITFTASDCSSCFKSCFGTLLLRNSGWHKPPPEPSLWNSQAESTCSSTPSKQLWHGFQDNKYPVAIVHVPASRVTLICHPWRPPGEESKCFVSVTKHPGLCWHSPVCRSTAVRDRGFSTTRQPGACAAPSCWMPHCSHCTSSAAGLSQNTLPFVPDTAARKAQGDGSPGDKRYQRELPLHHQELALTQLLSPHSFLSQSLTGTRRERTALTRRCFLNQVPLSRQDTLKPLLALLDLKAKSTSCTLSSFTSSIARKG